MSSTTPEVSTGYCRGSGDVCLRLSQLLQGPFKLAPLLMTSGLLVSVALTTISRSILADMVFLTALTIALIGGLMELYYLLLVTWASKATRGLGIGFTDILLSLIPIGLYYTLLGIAMISWRLNEHSKTLGCTCSSNTLYAIVTLGLYLAISQNCLSQCASSKLKEMITVEASTSMS